MTHRLLTGIATWVLLCWNSHSVMAGTTSLRQVSWEELSAVVGHKVRIMMPDGTLIQGRATALETDALAVDIQRTSNTATYPNGRFLLPRATLHAVDVVQRPATLGKLVGLTVGGGLGSLSGAAARSKSTWLGSPARVGFGVLAAALPLTGYFLGRAADRRVTTYVIKP